MGTTVIGGMLAASAIGIFFVPAIFYLVEKWSGAGKERASERSQQLLRQRRRTEMNYLKNGAKEERRGAPMKKLTRFIAATIASTLFAGCSVGPNYHRPAAQNPATFRDLSENPQVQAQAASYADLPWWQVFQDPQLQELIRTALKQNYDLQLATERINAGRAQLAVTRSNLFHRSKETAISAAEGT